MIRNVIFDFGNVLGRYMNKEMTAAICPVVFNRPYWDKLNYGGITACEAVGIRGILFDGNAAKLREILGINKN